MVDYNYLDLLNEQQREAVVYTGGPALVIAGAGSGKTRVLTYKIVHLLRMGYEPYRILALTFTNKAAREMKERIEALTGPKVSSRIWMGTFHSIFLRILRTHAEKLGFKPGFTIYDTNDSRSLIKTIIKERGLDEKAYKPATIGSIISNAKNALVYPEEYENDTTNYLEDKRAKRPETGRIFRDYVDRCRRANAMDFDDILFYMNVLLRDFPDVRRHYQEFFRFVMVDEYQDTNFAQHLIIQQLTDVNRNLCVVGDDAQSIYSFRGANIANILGMENKYPDLRVFKLERNYRSTQNIINAAGSLIEKNTRQMKKNVFSENDPGDKVRVMRTYSDIEEAAMVVNMISNSIQTRHDSLEDYAILYRTNAQSRVLEERLRARNMGYRIYGGLSFYQRKEIKDAIGYFRLALNPDDDEALKRVINTPARGIGETTVKKLQAAANEGGVSLFEVISNPDKYPAGFNKGTLSKLDGFRRIIDEFIEDVRKGSNAFEVGQLVYNRTGLLSQFLTDNTPEAISRQENLTELLAGLKDFVEVRRETDESDVSLAAYLSEVSLATDQDTGDEESGPKVTLMTAHASKGLEFKHVYIVGVEEELFPSAMSMDSLAQIEEERRLLYVAITRAKETCTMTYAGSRFRNGQTVMSRPSRFLGDIDTRYLQVVSSGRIDDVRGEFIDPTARYRSSVYGKGYSNRSTQYRKGPTTATSGTTAAARDLTQPAPAFHPDSAFRKHSAQELEKGMRIRHNRFGLGTITEVVNHPGQETINVTFDQEGAKKLMLKFAQFEIVVPN
ncbi:MAG: UvrD-helicase domain-containing protein [Bacteroides sp.]|nr:UvrD-helicase domain-containing protein [Bacteroides sp.]